MRILLIVIGLAANIALANPILMTDYSHESLLTYSQRLEIDLLYVALAAVCALLVEYVFLLSVFKWFNLQLMKLTLWFPIIHLFTFPMVQLFFGYAGGWTEIAAVLSETLVYNYFCGLSTLKKWSWIIVIIANVLSWFVGFLFLGFATDWQ